MDEEELAMQAVVADMGEAARKAKAGKYAKPPPAAPPAGLAGMMAQPGNSGAELAAESSISPEELEAILAGAK